MVMTSGPPQHEVSAAWAEIVMIAPRTIPRHPTHVLPPVARAPTSRCRNGVNIFIFVFIFQARWQSQSRARHLPACCYRRPRGQDRPRWGRRIWRPERERTRRRQRLRGMSGSDPASHSDKPNGLRASRPASELTLAGWLSNPAPNEFGPALTWVCFGLFSRSRIGSELPRPPY
jgi:hypothetical protein